MRVAVRRLDLKNAVADFENRDVVGSAAQVPDQNGFVPLLVQAVSERGRRRFVDDAQHLETGDLAGVFCCLPLRVVKVGGNRNNRFGYPLAQIVARVIYEFLKDHRRDLLRRIVLAVDLHAIVALAHMPLDRGDRAIGIGNRLTLCELTDEPFAGFCECDHRRRRSRTLGVGDNGGRGALHHCNDRIRRSQVDADHFCHKNCLPFRTHGPAVARRASAGRLLGLAAYWAQGHERLSVPIIVRHRHSYVPPLMTLMLGHLVAPRLRHGKKRVPQSP